MKTVTGCAISCVVESAAEMTVKCPQDISGLLTAWSNGDEEALRDLVSVVYPELRRIARQQLARRSPGHTLEFSRFGERSVSQTDSRAGHPLRKPCALLCSVRANDPAHSGGPCAQ